MRVGCEWVQEKKRTLNEKIKENQIGRADMEEFWNTEEIYDMEEILKKNGTNYNEGNECKNKRERYKGARDQRPLWIRVS